MIITPTMLNDDCMEIITRVGKYSLTAQTCLQIIYNTGCREAEVLDRSRWSIRGDLDWDLQPQKGNPLRVIPAAQITPAFVAYLDTKGWPSALSSRSNLRRAVQIFSSYPYMTCGGKGISSHRFRHNRIKQLKLAGQTPKQIAVTMGLVSLSIVNGYVYSTLKA